MDLKDNTPIGQGIMIFDENDSTPVSIKQVIFYIEVLELNKDNNEQTFIQYIEQCFANLYLGKKKCSCDLIILKNIINKQNIKIYVSIKENNVNKRFRSIKDIILEPLSDHYNNHKSQTWSIKKVEVFPMNRSNFILNLQKDIGSEWVILPPK